MKDDLLDLRPHFGRGGRSTTVHYHVSFRSGSRGTGACARSAYGYIARELEFDEPELDPAVHVESGHLPAWAHDEACAYWDAADLYERENGRLFLAGDFALPRDLELDEQIELARGFVHELTDPEQLPYTFSIHAGEDRDGHEHNPHVHVMVSERKNDGLERSREQWFRRANREHPERGGAPKSRTFHGRAWVEHARARLADRINERLRTLGREERVDHRSYERRGLDREPGEHFGPHGAHVIARTGEHDRLERAAEIDQAPERLADLDHRIQQLEHTRTVLLLEQRAMERELRSRDHSRSTTLERDHSRER
jgi:hypothetical protein